MKIMRIVMLFSVFCLLIAVSPSFAMDNDTVMEVPDEPILKTDYYFDAGVVNDTGDGSIHNPYKELGSNRIQDNSIIHLAKGEYTLERSNAYSNLTVIGENPQNTIIKYRDAVGFTSNGLITLKGVTLVDLRVNVNSNFKAVNTIFTNSSGSNSVVYSSSGHSNINLDNCTFSNNSAQNGGVISVSGGYLNIANSLFINNHADYLGGTISASNAEAFISNSRFINSYASDDAGGAIYLINSSLDANKVEFINCSALFGGAIASLSCDLNINNAVAKNNRAKYYGGAIFKMYSSFELLNSVFENNTALNGGALYVDMVDDFRINSNYFENNHASSTGGAVFSILSESYYDIVDKHLNNTFKNNGASYDKDVYQNMMANVNVGNNEYVLMRYNSDYTGNLPVRYDLRNFGFVTPVKNQGRGGNCWAFASLAALESAILKATNITYDLSEENMKNIASKYSEYGWAMETNVGGYDKMAVGYLTSWLGPVNENEDPYSESSVLSPLMNGLLHIQNIAFLTRDNYTDNDAIKKAIMEYGAVSTSIYWSSSYISQSKNYYYTGTSGANHAVAIVGWDDNYAASNFKSAPEGKGAWIIKNSWGLSGEQGYYYVSYYDTKFAQPGKYVSYAFILNDTIKYDKNYQYDIPGKTDFFYNESGVVWYKNRFTATDNEYLSAVSTYFDKDTTWDLFIYVNNALKLKQSGSANPSYKTIDLNSMIPLKVGDIFEVVFKIAVEKEAGVPISESISLNTELYGEGISFISYDGKNWADFYDLEWTYPEHTYNSQVACIKAFTVLDKIKTSVALEITDSFNPVEITARVLTDYGTLLSTGGVVTFNVEGKDIKVNLNNGVAKLTYAFSDKGDNPVKATFSGVGFVTSTSTITANPDEVVLKANDFSTYYKTFSYFVNLVNENNKPVPNKEIKFSVDNQEYIAKTDRNGLATIKLKLAAGTYKIKIGFNCSSSDIQALERNIEVKSTISIPANNKFTLNARYSANLIDGNGNSLQNCAVNVEVNGAKHVLTSDSYGNVNYNVNLAPGSYAITITNPATGEVKTQNIVVVPRLAQNSDLTTYYGAQSGYKVRAYDDNGNAASNVEVIFTVKGNSYSLITDSNGYASFTVDKSFTPGNYTITASYKSYKVSNNIAVKTTLSLPGDEKFTYNAVYSLHLTDSRGNPLKNTAVNVNVNGTVYNLVSDEKGNVNYTVDLAPGSYMIAVTNPLTGEVKTHYIEVAARITNNKNLAVYYGAGTSYKVRVYDDNGNIASGVTVTFTFNGKTYTRTSSSNGYATLKISKAVKPKTYTIKASYKGYEVSNKIVIKPTLILKDKTVKRSKTFKYTVKLLNNKGKILKSKYVKVTFKGKTYKAKTNSKGIATFKIKVNSKVGKFTLTSTYGSAKISKKITVKK